MPSSVSKPPRLTPRGAATRQRIVSAAADLMYARGVAATSLDDVILASGTGKSQLYHYFADKDALITEVVTTQIERTLTTQESLLGRMDSVRGLERWRDAEVLDSKRQKGGHGCPLGSLAGELAEQSEPARLALVAGFARWEGYLAAGLARMQDKGTLSMRADPQALAAGIMAALQGGLLLAQTMRDPHRVELALDLAVDHVRSLTFDHGRSPA